MRTQTVLTSILVTAVLALGGVSQSQAADKKADPNGTWSWTMQGRGGAAANPDAPVRKITLKLKADGEKLTGTIAQPAGRRGGDDAAAAAPRETEISDGKVKGDEISFAVKREFQGNAIVTKYTGKVEGDTITGKIETPGRDGGEARSRDWAAKREAAK